MPVLDRARPASVTPDRVFIASGAVLDVAIWPFYMAAIVWWVVDLEFGPLQLVLLGTFLEAMLLVAEVPTGVVADRYSRKWSVIIAYFLFGASMVLAVATTNFAVMLASQSLFGIAWTFRSGAEVAWLTDEMTALQPEAERDAEVDVSGLILRRHKIGMIAGILALGPGILIGRWSLRGLIAICGLVLILFAIWLIGAMTDNFRTGETGDEPDVRTIFRQGLATVRRVRSLRRLLQVMVLLGLGGEALDRLGFKRFFDEGDFGVDSLTYSAALLAGLGVFGVAVVWWSETQVAKNRNLAILTTWLVAVAAFGGVVAALGPALAVALGMAIEDPCREALDPVSAAWANREAPQEARATVHSFVSQAHGIGETVGGVSLGALAELAGIRWAILVAAALWAIGATIAWAARATLKSGPVTSAGGRSGAPEATATS